MVGTFDKRNQSNNQSENPITIQPINQSPDYSTSKSTSNRAFCRPHNRWTNLLGKAVVIEPTSQCHKHSIRELNSLCDYSNCLSVYLHVLGSWFPFYLLACRLPAKLLVHLYVKLFVVSVNVSSERLRINIVWLLVGKTE